MSNKKTWSLRIAISSVVVAVIGVLVAVVYGQLAHSDATSGSGQTINGDGNIQAGADAITGTNTCVIKNAAGPAVCFGTVPTVVSPDEDDKVAAAKLRSDQRPSGPGPWAFNVLFDDKIGLFVRSSPEQEGVRWGYMVHGEVMYVDCYAMSSFDPQPGLKYGPKWFKVHWPNNAESRASFPSSPADPAQGWAWGYFLQPNGHNGDIPACA